MGVEHISRLLNDLHKSMDKVEVENFVAKPRWDSYCWVGRITKGIYVTITVYDPTYNDHVKVFSGTYTPGGAKIMYMGWDAEELLEACADQVHDMIEELGGGR